MKLILDINLNILIVQKCHNTKHSTNNESKEKSLNEGMAKIYLDNVILKKYIQFLLKNEKIK